MWNFTEYGLIFLKIIRKFLEKNWFTSESWNKYYGMSSFSKDLHIAFYILVSISKIKKCHVQTSIRNNLPLMEFWKEIKGSIKLHYTEVIELHKWYWKQLFSNAHNYVPMIFWECPNISKCVEIDHKRYMRT